MRTMIEWIAGILLLALCFTVALEIIAEMIGWIRG